MRTSEINGFVSITQKTNQTSASATAKNEINKIRYDEKSIVEIPFHVIETQNDVISNRCQLYGQKPLTKYEAEAGNNAQTGSSRTQPPIPIVTSVQQNYNKSRAVDNADSTLAPVPL